MKHYLITPFDYPKDYPHTRERFDIFYKYTYPSVMAQTDKDFEWILLTSGVWTEEKKDLKIPNTTSVDKVSWVTKIGKCIQSRLDNDDMILPKFIESVKKNITEGHFVDFEGYRLDVPDKKLYTDRSYNPVNPSPFLSILDDRLIYNIAWHTDMHKHLRPLRVKERMWVQVIHPHSKSMSKKKCDTIGDYVCELKDMHERWKA